MATVLELENLSSERLYRFELDHLAPRATGADEQVVIEQARAGCPKARARLVEDCLRYIVTLADKFAFAYRRNYLDLVAQGNLIAVEHLNDALAADCTPTAYLRGKIHWGLVNYCNTTRTMITTPRDNGYSKKPPQPIHVDSLDITINEDEDITLADTLAAPDLRLVAEDAPTYQILHDVIPIVLTPLETEIIAKLYGFYGYAPETLSEIGEQRYGKRTSSAPGELKRSALKKLERAVMVMLRYKQEHAVRAA